MFPGSHCIFPSGSLGNRSCDKRWGETADKAARKQGIFFDKTRKGYGNDTLFNLDANA